MYVQTLDRSLGNSLQVGCILSRDHINVLRTRNASPSMSNYFLHIEKRQHITNYRRHEHMIGQHQLNMSSTFVQYLNSQDNFKLFEISLHCLVSTGDIKRYLFGMLRFVFESYKTPEELWRIITRHHS